ncbi:Clathrin-coated vesicle protein [Mycena kentingensis (nom. inval.)]|nr:Clathrin-coated vesicle protein [Mycena kentingensis (nom. inval.)]
MPTDSSARKVSKKLSTDDETDVRRARGELSCAECRRLKLKCDKKLPCSSCKGVLPFVQMAAFHRKASSHFPVYDGTHSQKGTRFVLASTDHLHTKIGEMGQRIRQLEDALAIFQASTGSNDAHPLLRDELLSIKFGPEKGTANETPMKPKEASTDSIDALGTLTIGDDGEAKYFGRSAGSETLFLAGAEMEMSSNVEDDEFPPLSLEIARLSNSFPFSACGPPGRALDLLFEYLPEQPRAWALCETYMEQCTWQFRPISREEMVDEFLTPVYKSVRDRKHWPNDAEFTHTISPHRLSVLFLMFALGALVDLTLEPHNVESDQYYHASRAALALRSVFDSPEMATVQAVLLMSSYHNMGGRRYTMESSASLLYVLAQSLGLHRDSQRWNMDPKIVNRRRSLFWETFSMELFQSIALGRPPSIRLSYVDCEFPAQEQILDEHGNPQISYHEWKYTFTRDVFSLITERTLTAEAPSYETVLELDRLVRAKTLPPYLNVFLARDDQNCTPSTYLRGCLLGQFRSVALLYIHRTFFAQAMLDHPANPLRSPYAPSFLAAYRCASGMIKANLNHFERFPELCCRWWLVWTHLFSAAIIVGCIVTRSPSSSMAPTAFIELGLACDLFEKGATQSRRARSGLAILCKLREKAFQVYSQFRTGNPTPPPTGFGLGSDYGDDELALFGGQTRVLVSKLISKKKKKDDNSAISTPIGDVSTASSPSVSGSASSDPVPDVHPSLVEYLSLLPPSAETPDAQPRPTSLQAQHQFQAPFESSQMQQQQLPGHPGYSSISAPPEPSMFTAQQPHTGGSAYDFYGYDQTYYNAAMGLALPDQSSYLADAEAPPKDMSDLGLLMSGDSGIDEQWKAEVKGENGEMYLFQWLSATEKAVKNATPDYLKTKQSLVEGALVKVVLAQDPYPIPGRALRNCVARCFVLLYSRGETRTLFDTLQSFMKVVIDFKGADRDLYKIAAFSVIGDLMYVFGSQFMSFMMELTTTVMRTVRSSSTPLLRYHALVALQKALTTASRAVTEAAFKDLAKQMRNALTDKCLPVQRGAAQVLVALYSGSDGQPLPSAAEVEGILAQCIKSLDAADQLTRTALASLVGHVLASTQITRQVVVAEPKATKKDKKQGEADDDDTSPAGAHAAAETAKPTLTPIEMLTTLSTHFNKAATSRKTRMGIFDFYSALITKLGPSFVESQYALLVAHFAAEIVVGPLGRVARTRYENLLMRSLVGVILRDLIGERMLSEQGQIGAIRELANVYLKRWPAMMPGSVAPNQHVLVVVLREVAGLLQQLGNAPPPVQDAVSEPLVTLLAHPNHTVRVNAAWALRCFCYSTPLRLPKTIITVMDLLQRDLAQLLTPTASPDVPFRALGHAYGLAALVSIIPARPLYVSYDASAKVLDMATTLLKRAGEHDVRVAGTEVEVAWTALAALMALGPNFVRPHLPQLLVLWRNALPKPTSKDASAGRTHAEWGFLLHVRESALGAVLCFLRHNSGTLVTLDVARRIASVLSNALLFANNFVSPAVQDALGISDPNSQIALQQAAISAASGTIPLPVREALLRRRVHQCFAALGFSGITELTQSTLLQSCVSLFASPDVYPGAGSAVQAAIAASSGAFTSIWTSNGDGYAHGVTFIDLGDEIGEDGKRTKEQDTLNRDSVQVAIDGLFRKPILGACEHDPLSLCQARFSNDEYQLEEPPPALTSVVDTAIELFAQLLPLQDLTTTGKIVTLLTESVRSSKLEKNVGRKAAVSVNGAVALALALRQAMATQSRRPRETFGNTQVTDKLMSFLKDTLVDGDPVLRSAGSESIGRLANLAGTNFLTFQMKTLVDQVVNNRDPSCRAGCALAFGAIYSHVGGLAAGPLLKTTVNVLMSLSIDPHPTVHFWALTALGTVMHAASLAYAPYVSSTLGMLLKVYTMESHEREGGTLSNANLSGDCQAYPVICQITDAIVNILGPDMQESSRTRTLILNLVHEFSLESDDGIRVEAIKCMQHFLMFAPEHVDIPDLVKQFRVYLASSRRPLKLASINALYQLVQKDALAMSRLGGDRLVEDLFGMLDDDSSVQGVRDVITGWLQQTVAHNPSAWIDLCQRIMSRTTASQQVVDAASGGGPRDDEGESLNVGAEGGQKLGTCRWRTQLFALQCLHKICTLVGPRKEHVDIRRARALGLPVSQLLLSRVPDLIKMAFTASAAYVTEIRIEGLVVLRDVIEIFAASPDPAYDDALLLEQHQAPITAALTPAFSSDSTPEILASAVHACAVFVGCGVVKDVGRMGRILRLLTAALEQSKDAGMLSLGDTGELGPNASAMLRISTVSAWAQLKISSAQQTYLADVIEPYRATLASLWLASLRDYASIRVDSEFLHDTSSVALDSSYSSLGKEVLLPYYANSWSVILQAVATTMQANDPNILAAMDGFEFGKGTPVSVPDSKRSEPTMFFFVLFGLVYEALATASADANSTSPTRQSTVIAALQTLKCLVRPEYAGNAILEASILDEFLSLCYRMAMTETAAIQTHLVEVRVLMAQRGSTFAHVSLFALSSDLFAYSPAFNISLEGINYSCVDELLKLTLTLRCTEGDAADRIKMILMAFASYVSIATSFNGSNREDVRGVGILLYSDLLKDESSEIDLVGPTLPALKSLLDIPTTSSTELDTFSRLVHGLISSCLLNVDEMGGRSGVIAAKKIKNNLLAAVLILTVIPPTVKIGEPVVEHCCFLITQKLLDAGDLSLPAVHCAKTLIVASTSDNPLLHHCTRLLIPGVVEYIAKMAPLVSDGSISEPHATAVGEVWKAFSALFASVPDEKKARLLGVFLPTITLLLSNPQAAATQVTAQSIRELLTYATSAPAAFKEAAGKLEPSIRELLEQSVAKPQISLRSF